MKLVSNRDYKHDHSDIVGILRDHAKNGELITKDQIESAVERLYDSVDAVSGRAWEFLDNVIKDGNYDKLYEITSVNEQENELLLTDEIEQNSGIVQTASMNDILAELRDQGVDDDVSDDLSAG